MVDETEGPQETTPPTAPEGPRTAPELPLDLPPPITARGDPRPEGVAPRGRKPDGADTIAELLYHLDQSPDTGTVEVRRASRSGGPMEYICRMDLTGFDLEDLRRIYGGGKYNIIVRDAAGGYLFQRSIAIAGRTKQPTIPDEDTGPTAPGPDRTTLGLIDDLARKLDRIADQVRHHPPEAQGKNAFELALALAEHTRATTAPYLDALLERSKGGGKAEDMVEILLKGIELARDLQPPADPMVPVLTQLAVPLLTQLTQPGANPAVRAAAPNPPPGRALPTGARRPWDVMLTPWLPQLQKWASRGKDARARALFVVDEIPDEVVQLFGEQIERGEAFLAEFFQLHPETRQFETWYRAFWDGIAEGMTWEGVEDEEPDSDNAEPSDVPEQG